MSRKPVGKIHINSNLGDVMRSMGFDEPTCDLFQERFSGTDQRSYSFWKDTDGEEFVTIDLCVEIPMRCCTVIE